MPPPNNRRPFPDKAHEDLARWVEETIAGLSNNQADTDDSLLLVDVLFAMVEDAIAARDALRIRIDAVKIQAKTGIDNADALQVQLAELTDRVAALEAAAVPPTGPDAAG